MRDAQRHVAWLDGWRGAAVACVLAGHFGGPYFLGHFGVDAFFVLSGVLISTILYERKQALPEFFWRRAARILPALWFFLLVMHGVDALFGFFVPANELVAELLFVRNYWPDRLTLWMDGTLPFGHLWSLNVEEQAYVAMAMVAWLFRSRQLVASAVLLSGSLICVGFDIFYSYQPESPGLPFVIHTEVAAFEILLSAGLSRLIACRRWRFAPWISGASLLLAVLLGTPDNARMSLFLVLVPALLAISINALVACRDDGKTPLHRAFSLRGLQWLGRVSFSVYIWQQPLHRLYMQGKIPGPGMLWLVASVAIGVAAYFLIERPCRRWLVGHTPWTDRAVKI